MTFEAGFTFKVNTPVPDGNVNGLMLATNLLVVGSISSVNLGLDAGRGCNGGLHACLAGAGRRVCRAAQTGFGMGNNARAFGCADSGMSVTFSDTAANSVQYCQNYTNTAGGMVLGNWQPEGVNMDPLTNDPSAFLLAGQTAMLSSFDGNGKPIRQVGLMPMAVRQVREPATIPSSKVATIFNRKVRSVPGSSLRPASSRWLLITLECWCHGTGSRPGMIQVPFAARRPRCRCSG